MDLGLQGKRALITGGSRGIGFAVARALAAEQAAVGLIARDPAGLAEAAARLADLSAPVATAPADVTDTPTLHRAVDEIAAALGGLDHLVANAGGTVGGGNLANSRDDEFTATLALNAGHAAELIRAGLPHLRAAGGGSVVIISSITGLRPAPRTAYAAAKAAEIQLAATAAAGTGARRHPGERGQPRVHHVPGRLLGHLPAGESGRLRRLPRHPVPVRAAGPPGRGRRRGRVPALGREHRGSPARTSWWTAASATRAPGVSTDLREKDPAYQSPPAP